MEEDLISKKELLETMGISYGQLYRWKRKGLLPEDWFIRKSTFTGQETFFPKAKILTRISKIQSRKDDVSLSELADAFSPGLENIVLRPEELPAKGIVSAQALAVYRQLAGEAENYAFEELLSVYVLGRLLEDGKIGREEAQIVLGTLREGRVKFPGEASALVLWRKLGVFGCFVASPPCRFCADSGLKIIDTVEINTAVEELKLKLL